MTGIELQRVWRTLSETDGSGFFVWDVTQVLGTISDRATKQFTKAADGSYLMEACYHFFTLEKAIDFLHDNEFSGYQEVTIIGKDYR